MNEAREVFLAQGDQNRFDLAKALMILATIELDPDRSISGMTEALEVLQPGGDPVLAAECLQSLGGLYFSICSYGPARMYEEASLNLVREIEDKTQKQPA